MDSPAQEQPAPASDTPPSTRGALGQFLAEPPYRSEAAARNERRIPADLLSADGPTTFRKYGTGRPAPDAVACPRTCDPLPVASIRHRRCDGLQSQRTVGAKALWAIAIAVLPIPGLAVLAAGWLAPGALIRVSGPTDIALYPAPAPNRHVCQPGAAVHLRRATREPAAAWRHPWADWS